MYYYKKDERTERERYLEDEVDRLEQERRADDDRREQQRQERERERKEQREYEMREADTWPEALRKDIHLLRREIDQEYEATDGDWFFTDSAAACERALQIWSEHEKAHAERIEELHRLIEQEKESIRQGVANHLEQEAPLRKRTNGEELPSYGWTGIANALRNCDDPSELLNW